MSAPPSAPEPRLIARSIISRVMLAAKALSTAARNLALTAGSATPARVATVISRISLVKTLARFASSAFLRPSTVGPLPMTSYLNQPDKQSILPHFHAGPRCPCPRSIVDKAPQPATAGAVGTPRHGGMRRREASLPPPVDLGALANVDHQAPAIDGVVPGRARCRGVRVPAGSANRGRGQVAQRGWRDVGARARAAGDDIVAGIAAGGGKGAKGHWFARTHVAVGVARAGTEEHVVAGQHAFAGQCHVGGSGAVVDLVAANCGELKGQPRSSTSTSSPRVA